MMTRATQENLECGIGIDNLLLVSPKTEFSDYLEKIDELVEFAPEIITAINNDLDRNAKEKKRVRLADKEFYQSQTEDLPGYKSTGEIVEAIDLELGTGRPRMPGYLVYVFLMVRGYKASVSDRQALTFIKESISLHVFLERRGYTIPGRTTILENINAVRNPTRDYFLKSSRPSSAILRTWQS